MGDYNVAIYQPGNAARGRGAYDPMLPYPYGFVLMRLRMDGGAQEAIQAGMQRCILHFGQPEGNPDWACLIGMAQRVDIYKQARPLIYAAPLPRYLGAFTSDFLWRGAYENALLDYARQRNGNPSTAFAKARWLDYPAFHKPKAIGDAFRIDGDLVDNRAQLDVHYKLLTPDLAYCEEPARFKG